MHKFLTCFSLAALFLTFASAQSVSIPPNDFLRFTGGTGDINDGVIANSRFGPQGLNIVGINNDNTYRKLHVWGQITQHQNDGTNSFLGSTTFNGSTYTTGDASFNASTYTNGTVGVGIGPGSYFRAGAYLTMGHTADYYSPYIAFNALLTASSFSTPGNWFSPCYSGPMGSGLILTADPGRGTLKFYQKIYDGNPASFNMADLQPSMFLNENGQFGIGFPYAFDFGNNCKFAVKGTILATRVRVSQTGPWPDYVFEPTYSLRPLDSLEAFVNKNKHLPDVLPAAQVEKEGIELGENQATLLRKIEELTLYLIELKKSGQQQQLQIQQQAKEIQALKTAVGQ